MLAVKLPVSPGPACFVEMRGVRCDEQPAGGAFSNGGIQANELRWRVIGNPEAIQSNLFRGPGKPAVFTNAVLVRTYNAQLAKVRPLNRSWMLGNGADAT